jgi:PqqA peptide cyclase
VRAASTRQEPKEQPIVFRNDANSKRIAAQARDSDSEDREQKS